MSEKIATSSYVIVGLAKLGLVVTVAIHAAKASGWLLAGIIGVLVLDIVHVALRVN